MNNAEIREILYSKNTEFRRISDKHKSFEEELENIQTKKYLTDEEQLKAKSIKKEKLRLKDKMERMISTYDKEH